MASKTIGDKILLGLEHCLPYDANDSTCKSCPYDPCTTECVNLPVRMVEDIRGYLKGGKVGMTEQEKRVKVIKGIECHHFVAIRPCENCPYYQDKDCVNSLAKDALDLLKAQEPVTPNFSRMLDHDIQIYTCGACGKEVGADCVNYCQHCGKEIKWE